MPDQRPAREQMEEIEEIEAALRALGLEVAEQDGDLIVDGVRLGLTIEARAHPTPADLALLVNQRRGAGPMLVVADRLSEAGRDVLRSAGWGWLDRRGHLRLWVPGLRLECPVPGGRSVRTRSSNPWTPVGLEVALAALIEPAERVSARRVAALTGRSVGAVHEMISRFTDVGLIGPTTGRPLLPELFWETAAHWPDDGWIPLPLAPEEVGQRVGAAVFIRVDERAATLGGARIAAAGDLAARGYLTSEQSLRKMRSMVDRDQPTRCWVRAAPVRWLPDNPEFPPDDRHPWRIGHPVVCALRLGADPARGREIVESWGVVPEGS